MEEEEDMSPPFWLLNSGSFGRQSNRLHRSSSSVFFSSGAFVLALLAIALVFIFFVIPSILSFTSQVFRPHLVKKSWDSLNLVLVLFAIVCGFLSRNTSNENNNNTPKYSYDQVDHHQTVFNAPSDVSSSQQEIQKSNPSTPRQWYDQYADRTAYNNTSFTSTMNRGVRTSSSYPDLRQQESSWNVTRDDGWRFYDDTRVSNYRVSGSDHLHHRRHRSWHDELGQPPPVQEEEESIHTKNIQVDTFVIRPEQIPTTQSDPPLPSPPRKEKRTYQALGGKEHSSANNDTLDVKKNLPSAPPSRPSPSPPSPPPLPPKDVVSKRWSAGKNVKKRGVATTKEFIVTSLRGKKKKQRQKSVENFETLLASASLAPSSSLLPPPSPPPPPPPLPPPSVFHNMFSSKKSNKPKKTIHSIPQPPSSPPPPPRTTPTARLAKTNPQIRPMMTTQKQPLSVKVKNFINGDDENASSGGESPLIGIPPPPPLPPFGLPQMKYVVVHDDYVRLKSGDSSRSSSPDLDDDQDSLSSPTTPTETSGKTLLESGESPFCPSPDVNTKAETFIARFRAELRLEKMNSVRGRSNLGPDPR